VLQQRTGTDENLHIQVERAQRIRNHAARAVVIVDHAYEVASHGH
jgi:hypothetical protein